MCRNANAQSARPRSMTLCLRRALVLAAVLGADAFTPGSREHALARWVESEGGFVGDVACAGRWCAGDADCTSDGGGGGDAVSATGGGCRCSSAAAAAAACCGARRWTRCAKRAKRSTRSGGGDSDEPLIASRRVETTTEESKVRKGRAEQCQRRKTLPTKLRPPTPRQIANRNR